MPHTPHRELESVPGQRARSLPQAAPESWHVAAEVLHATAEAWHRLSKVIILKRKKGQGQHFYKFILFLSHFLIFGREVHKVT